jgi:hypothetical protein
MASIFTAGILCFVLLWVNAPPITAEEKKTILTIPNSPQDLSNTLKVLDRYNQDHQLYVTSIWVYLYIL